MKLRPYQQEFFSKVRDALDAKCNRQLGVLATGLGKAILFATLREQLGFERKILVLIHREELAAQAARQLQHWNPGLMIGVEMADSSAAPMDQLIVGSVPTLGRRKSSRILKFHPDEFDVVVSDEAHHISPGSRWANVLEYFGVLRPGESHILSLGLTATPNRSDGHALRDFYDLIVFSMGLWEGIESGYLVPLESWLVQSKSNLDSVHTHAGEFAEDELADAVNTPERNAAIVREWMKRAYGKRTLAFCVNIQHSADLAAMFRHYSISAEPIWGVDPERAAKFARHRGGETTVLTNCQLAREGYDDRDIECIILGMPHKAALPVEQEIGRGTRLPTGIDNLLEAIKNGVRLSKDRCIILSVQDIATKHELFDVPTLFGLPTGMDLEGKSVTYAKKKYEQVAKEYPTADLSQIKSLSKLESVSKSLELFKVNYPPEIARMSEFAWRKSAEGYMLVFKRDLVTVAQDLRGDWQIRGRIGEHVAEFSAQNLPGAMNLADKFVVDHGGIKAILSRDRRWHGDPPTEKQLSLCRILKLVVPANATKGQVSAAIDARRMQQRRGI